MPNNGQIAAKLNPGRTKRRLTRLAEGAKRAETKRAKGKCVWEEVQNRQRRSKLGRGAKRARGKLGRGGAKLDER